MVVNRFRFPVDQSKKVGKSLVQNEIVLKKHFLARVALGLTYNYEGDQYTWEEVTITIGLIDVMIIHTSYLSRAPRALPV